LRHRGDGYAIDGVIEGFAHRLAVALVLKDPRAAQNPGDARIVFAICFAGLGAVMLVLNCFLAAYADRFMLPMMLSLLVAVIFILAALLDEICLRALK